MASGLGAAMESVGSAIALLALPALATAVAVFFTTRSAVARMLSTASVIAVAIFVYYGVQAPGVWSFFHWRWSGCVVLFSLCLGAALTAPLLAESWKRRSWPLRLILYLPLFAAAVVFERNVTGTDDALIFAISPWPVVQVFGLEVFASVIALLLIGVAIGLWMVSRGLERTAGDLHRPLHRRSRARGGDSDRRPVAGIRAGPAALPSGPGAPRRHRRDRAGDAGHRRDARRRPRLGQARRSGAHLGSGRAAAGAALAGGTELDPPRLHDHPR